MDNKQEQTNQKLAQDCIDEHIKAVTQEKVQEAIRILRVVGVTFDTTSYEAKRHPSGCKDYTEVTLHMPISYLNDEAVRMLVGSDPGDSFRDIIPYEPEPVDYSKIRLCRCAKCDGRGWLGFNPKTMASLKCPACNGTGLDYIREPETETKPNEVEPGWKSSLRNAFMKGDK